MLTGAYSQKFKDLEQDRLSRSSSNDSLSHAQQLAARDKVRQLSLETNRRRRAQELKRRLEAQKEAKRRQGVLEERRRRQQEATQKYQRGQRTPPKPVPRSGSGSGKSYSDSRLQDGVNIAKGYGQNASYTGNYGNQAPALEEALKMVGVHTAPASSINYRGGGYGGGSDYSTEYRRGHSDTGIAYNRENYTTDGPYRRPGMDSNGNTISENKGHNYHGYATTATAVYNSNANREATGTRFQQTLHEQQRQLMEQQQAALNEFNQAVLSETTLPSQGEELQHSSSLSSLDSLEEEQPKSHKILSYDGRGNQAGSNSFKPMQGSSKPRMSDRDTLLGVDGAPNYPVPTRTAQGGNDSRSVKEPLQNGTSAVSDKLLFTPQSSSQHQPHQTTNAHNHSRGGINGELLVEETSESDFVREPVETKPTLIQGSKDLSSQHGPYSTRTSQAWTSKIPSEGPHFHTAYDSSHSPGRYVTGPVGIQVSHRPFSARTSATTVSNYPARLPEPPSNHSHHEGRQVTDPGAMKKTPTNSTPTRTVNFAPSATKNSSFLEEQPASKKENKKFDDPLETPERIVKSILKRSQRNNATTQKVKLGGFKVKDSLEISRAIQVTQSDRKSVRWTDLKYTEEEEEAEMAKDQRSLSERPPKSVLTRPEDNPTKDQVKSQRQTPSSGTPPRGPTKLQRRANSASKPPQGRPISGHARKHTESENNKVVSRVSGKVLHPQTESTDKYSAGVTENGRVYQNGIHLDKTPTDDEINWLWDKVRTCLNTQEQTTTGPGSDSSSGRQPASLSKQFIDGNRLTANLRVSAQGHMATTDKTQDRPLTGQKKYNTYPRFRTNSESSSASLRKTALLHQRRQHGAVGNMRPGYQGRSNQHYTGPVPGLHPSPPSAVAHHQTGPTSSNQGPMRATGGIPHGQNQEVSESLLMFQRAEQLAAQENMSESEIAAAIDHQPNNTFMQKVPTALSMEEQRILESLDKLNAQLRTVTSETNAAIQPYAMMQPRPPPQGSGSRSQRPISARQRAVASANVPNRVRTFSADRSNARINYYQ